MTTQNSQIAMSVMLGKSSPSVHSKFRATNTPKVNTNIEQSYETLLKNSARGVSLEQFDDKSHKEASPQSLKKVSTQQATTVPGTSIINTE